MGGLTPLAFDVETTGLGPDAAITVAGIDAPPGAWLVLNTDGRPADTTALERALAEIDSRDPEVVVVDCENQLLDALTAVVADRVDPDGHYLVAYNGERWRGGFDLPHLRRRCLVHDAPWPFTDLAYVDVCDVVDRIATGDATDLVTVYDQLVGGTRGDPFADSAGAVDAWDDERWADLLAHNLADVRRTRELAVLAERYVPRSDFKMKRLDPPGV
jgi:uncharacterized protein YprB with RNaseH-like and TPR domain